MKTCTTCNASHKNTVERVLRCMGCVAKPSGNSNWRPLVPNAELTGREAVRLDAGLCGEKTGECPYCGAPNKRKCFCKRRRRCKSN